MTGATIQVGQTVHVRAAGTWREGHVTRLARTRATVLFVRNRTGETSQRPFPLGEIRPAIGVRLVPVDQLRAGAVVITDTGDHIVDRVETSRRRQRRIHFAGEHTMLINAGTMVRIRQP